MDELSQSMSKQYSVFDQESKNQFVADLFHIAKTKRQDNCWCGSNKRFIDCHAGRESERIISESQMRSEISKIMDDPKFCCATFDSNNCNGIIKGAHTIQRGRVLASMTNDNHVGTFYRNRFGFDKIISIQNGIKHQASIFYGFCDFHDVDLFKGFEVSEFTVTVENCWASSYRAICHEYYQKSAAKDAVLWMKENLDKGRQLYEQLMIQENLALLEIDIHKGFDDIHRIKIEFEKIRTHFQYKRFTSYVIQLDKPLDIAVCGTVAPFHDLLGKKIQNLGDPHKLFEHFFISTVTMSGNAAYVISYLDSHHIIIAYLKALFSRDYQFIIQWLTKSIFAHSENTYFRLDWWTGIDKQRQQAIYDLAMVENYTQPFAYDDLVSGSTTGKIVSITKI
ncbi:metal-binding protein [Cellvibrio sp. UBA7671]|uniref:metal-binding protein n=1 Tax=Cellvibrio sp. UBA7671 TaxID=1946312 RepID=UPI002F34FCB4